MDFDAGHGRIDRRGLDVEQPDRRGADQHELAGEPLGRHAPFEHVLGGHVTAPDRAAEMDPELRRCGRSGFRGPGTATLCDAGRVGPDQDGAGAGDDAQHFERQRRHDDAAAPSSPSARGARCRRARGGW